MATTTPYQQNDYQAVGSFRPYRLPVNDIFKATAAVNAFWDEGARKVKNVYENALDLKLSLAPNKETRDQFMKEADKQLTKLSSMNLADASVQRQGMGIFKPLLQDEAVISDDAATRHIEKVHADALGFRSKENGKFYSSYNHQYALLGSDEFKNSNDRMAGKAYLAKRKEYEPFHDYTKDFEDALKNCEPDSSVNTDPRYSNGKMTGYSDFNKNKSLSAAKARGCLEGNLNPKAWRQLEIEGAVAYNGHVDVLAADVGTYLGGVSENLAGELQKMAAMKMAVNDDKNMSAADKAAAIKAINDKSKGISDEIGNNSITLDKIRKKDYTDILNNYDKMAAAVYSQRKIYKKALAAAYLDIEHSSISDPTQLVAIKAEIEEHMKGVDYKYDVSLADQAQNNAVILKNMELQAAAKAGKVPGADGDKTPMKGKAFTIDPTTGEVKMAPLSFSHPNVGPGATPDETAFKDLNDRVTKLSTENINNNLGLYNEIIKRGNDEPEFKKALMEAFGETDWQAFQNKTRDNQFMIPGHGGRGHEGKGGIQDTKWFKDYFPMAKDNPVFNKWADNNTQIEIGVGTLNRKIEMGERQVLHELTPPGMKLKSVDDLTTAAIANLKNVRTTAGDVTPKMVNDAFQQKGPLRIEVLPGAATTGVSSMVGGLGPGTPNTPVGEIVYTLNGTRLTNQEVQDSGLGKLRHSVAVATGATTEKINKKRAEIYGNLGFARNRWAFTHDDNSEYVEMLRSKFPDNDGKKNTVINIEQSDLSGGIKINHPGVTADDLDKYRNIGIGMTAKIEDGYVVLSGTDYNVVPKALDSPVMRDVAYQMQTVGSSYAFQKSQRGTRVDQATVKIPVWTSGTRRQAKIETHNEDGKPIFKLVIEGTTIPGPAIVANNPYDLFEKIAIMQRTGQMNFKAPTK